MRVRRSSTARSRGLLLGPLLAPLLIATGGPPAAGSVLTHPARSGPSCGRQFRLDRGDFPARPKVSNRWFPLAPGTQWTLRGSVAGSAHKVVTTVTDLTKAVDGVRTVVVLDEDFDGADLQEAELAFFAQDEDGTVWALGEYPELYDNGTLTGAPATWIVGVQHATTGIAMRRRPVVGTPAYRQGFSPNIGFDDCGVVLRNGASTSVPTGAYHDVLVTDEWAPNAPDDGHQRKFYAQGVGLVRVEPVGGADPEILVLSTFTRLGSASLAKVHKRALQMDARGYTVSPDVYGHTPHAR